MKYSHHGEEESGEESWLVFDAGGIVLSAHVLPEGEVEGLTLEVNILGAHWNLELVHVALSNSSLWVSSLNGWDKGLTDSSLSAPSWLVFSPEGDLNV